MNRFRFIIVVVLLLSTALLLHARRKIERVPNSKDFAAFPMSIGSWIGENVKITDTVLQVLGPGKFLSRIYQQSPATSPYIDLFIAYFPSQQAGDTIHSPKNCLPGSGWTFTDTRQIDLPAPDGKSLRVNRFIINKGTDRQLVLYWYQAHGRAVYSEYWAKIYLVTDAIRMNRTDGSMVRVITPIAPNEPEAQAEKRVVGFTEQLLPMLDQYIPR